jgi:TPR repeat protein
MRRGCQFGRAKSLVGRVLISAVLISSLPISGALAGWLPPKPAGDDMKAQVPMSRQVVKAALADPRLQAAFQLVTGPLLQWPKGADLTRDLANGGNPVAQTAICVLHKLGHGVTVDWDQARRWCLEAANQGYGPAQYELASLLNAGDAGDQPAVKIEIQHWLRQAARQDLALGYISLARLYVLGDGVPKDLAIASRLLQEAGRIPSVCQPLIASAKARYGLGMAIDDKRANASLILAARAQCWPAQYALAGFLKQGAAGMTADAAESKSWLTEAMMAEVIDAYGQKSGRPPLPN